MENEWYFMGYCMGLDRFRDENESDGYTREFVDQVQGEEF